MKEVRIDTDIIKLDQLLKWSGAADSGASAKQMILDGVVRINGEIVLQRGKKVYRGDKVSINNEYEFTVI
jgi:ribosome-associated protein